MEKQQRTALPLGGKAGGLAFTTLVAVNTLIGLIISLIINAAGIGGTDGAKYVAYLVSPVAIAITLTLALKVARQNPKQLFPVKTHYKYYVLAVLLIFGLLFSLNSLNEYFIRLLELIGYTRKPGSLPDVSGWKVIPVLIVVAVIPALAEEVMFRGILLANAEEGTGSVRAVLITGFCFSLYHGSVEQTLYQFVCGCLFALLAIRSRSILPSVIIHFLNNAIIIILYACGAVDAQTGNLLISQTGNIILCVLSGVSLAGAVVWLILDKKLLRLCKKGEVAAFFLYAAVGIISLAVIWITGLFNL